MKKKLLSVVAAFMLCILMFAADNMYLKLRDGKIVSYDIADVEEMYFGEAPVDDTPPVDSSVVDDTNPPLKFRILTDSTAEVIEDNLYYRLDSIIIPSQVGIDGKIYTVTSIDNHAFTHCIFSESAFIPSSVTNIGYEAFYKSSKLDIVVDNKLDSVNLGNLAFCECKSVTFAKDSFPVDSSAINSLLLPFIFNVISDSTVEVAAASGATTETTGLVIPPKVQIRENVYTVTHIATNAFLYASNMTSIELPSTITSIGFYAFSGCNYLKSITLPSSLVEIKCSAFASSGLTSVEIPSDVMIDSEAFYACGSLTNVRIKSGCFIGNSTFDGCVNMTSLVIDSGVSIISKKAFLECRSLTELTIPSSVKKIGDFAFYGCASLDLVIDNYKDSVILGEDAVRSCKSVTYTKDAVADEDDVIDESETTFEFELTSDSTVEVVNCSSNYSLTTATIPSKVRIGGVVYAVNGIGKSAFDRCIYLESVYIPSSVTFIGNNAFWGCTKLDVVVENSKKDVSLGTESFCYCKSVKFTKDPNVEDPDALNYLTSVLKFTVLTDSTAEVGALSVGFYFYDYYDLVIPSKVLLEDNKVYTVTRIATDGFASTNIESVVIPSSIERVGYRAFSSCNNLKKVELPTTRIELMANSFQGVTLGDLTITANIGIESETFYGASLGTVVVDSGAFITSKSFRGSGIKELIIKPGVGSIGKQAFFECGLLEKVTIPSSVTYIGEGAFYQCKNADIVIDNSADYVELGMEVFTGCKSVTYTKGLYVNGDSSIETAYLTHFSYKVTSDSTVAFASYDHSFGYDTIRIPARVGIKGNIYSVTSIGQNALVSCPVNVVEIPSTVTTIEEGAFTGVRLEKIVIPSSVKTIKSKAFADCKDLEVVVDNEKAKVDVAEDSFKGCKSVKYSNDTSVDTNPEDDKDPIDVTTSLKYKVLTDSTVEVTADNSYRSLDSVVIPDNVEIDGVTYVVTSIGNKAFYGCSSIKTVKIPTTVSNIESYAFNACSGLTSVEVHPNTALGYGAFMGCSGLTSAVIHSSCLIGDYAFAICLKLKELTIESGVTTIGKYAFTECSTLTNLEIPSSVTYIRTGAFSGCKSLDVVIDNTKENIKTDADPFADCHSVTYNE